MYVQFLYLKKETKKRGRLQLEYKNCLVFCLVASVDLPQRASSSLYKVVFSFPYFNSLCFCFFSVSLFLSWQWDRIWNHRWERETEEKKGGSLFGRRENGRMGVWTCTFRRRKRERARVCVCVKKRDGVFVCVCEREKDEEREFFETTCLCFWKRRLASLVVMSKPM